MDEAVAAPAENPPRVARATAARPLGAYLAPRATFVRPPRSGELNDFEAHSEIDQRTGGPTIGGKRALLRNGVAYAPSQAPEKVKNAIWAANSLRRKPYAWGGGHRSFKDNGYDCSGSVSFTLHGAGLLNAPVPSSDLMRYGSRGRGRWITIYSKPGHVFAVIAGLRLDTTDLDRGADVGPRWYVNGRNTYGYVARHPEGL